MNALLPGLLLLVATASADTLPPIPRIDSVCPPGYYRNGSYCVPNTSSHREREVKQALPRVGPTCPPGYYRNGSYCVDNK
jgi:hypothetical protein